jgi:hypothetical protein
MDYWQRVDEVVQAEPIEARDIFFHAMLRPLGIEKGKPFKPDARQTRILTDARWWAKPWRRRTPRTAASRATSIDPTRIGTSRCCSMPMHPDAFWNLLDERASWFYEAVGAGAAMAPKRPGPSSAYLSAYKDKDRRVAGRRQIVSSARAARPTDQTVLVGHSLRRRYRAR